jgi:chromosome segregation ATPase
MFYRVCVPFVLMVLVSGCQFTYDFRPESEIRQEVLDSDPSFAAVIDIKKEIDNSIALINSETGLKSNDIESKILTLKRELRALREDSAKKIKSLNSRLDPYRAEISQCIAELSTELKLKQSSLSAVNNMIAELNRLSSRSDFQDASEAGDAVRLREKIAHQNQQADILNQDIAVLREKIRLLRLKKKLIN